MDDLISRQAAIDAVRELYIQSPKINNDIVYDTAIDQAHDTLVNLPPAQPEPCEDTISRKAAIDAMDDIGNCVKIDGEDYYILQSEAIENLKKLPLAQPEIIRCKECANADENYHCDYMTTWNYGDCFCS